MICINRLFLQTVKLALISFKREEGKWISAKILLLVAFNTFCISLMDSRNFKEHNIWPRLFLCEIEQARQNIPCRFDVSGVPQMFDLWILLQFF